MNKIDYSKISENPKVIELIKQREKLEEEIRELDKNALLEYEMLYLSIN